MRRLMLNSCLVLLTLPLLSPFANSAPSTPDWSENASIDPSGRENPYGWDETTFKEKVRAGKIHALNYPVSVTGLLVPARSSLQLLDAEPGTPFFGLFKTILSLGSDFKNFKGFWEWLGLNDYPKEDRDIPFPDGKRPDYPMGVSMITRGKTKGLTFGCAVCHASQLFGKPVLGLSNRFPQSNLLFIYGKKAFHSLPPELFKILAKASPGEKQMYQESRERILSVGATRPKKLGLDTSLSQVALSLARRAKTPWAERTSENAEHPRANVLDSLVADSKPAVWWNIKYKNRWLSDGGVLSGNPIYTVFLWNEIGRGTDLPDLVSWLSQNQSVVEELTTAVFATEAPKYRDFFGESAIHIERAKRGEKLFVENCARCHGRYEKAWSIPATAFHQARSNQPNLRPADTIKVVYHRKTPVIDVGTDSGRREGMQAIADGLNPLEYSKMYGIRIETQSGYVPPPLEGIWSRYPYFHNNSIPNLCALMMAPSRRPQVYYSGNPIDPDRDFDQECVGYPVGAKTPREWITAKNSEQHRFDASIVGLSNQGHYDGIFTDEDGNERFDSYQKQDLIEFLKTL